VGATIIAALSVRIVAMMYVTHAIVNIAIQRKQQIKSGIGKIAELN
jgi:hypothetical protein